MTWRSDWQQPQPLPTGMPWPKPACTISMPCTGCFTRGICDQLRWESGYQVAKAEHAAKLAAAERTIEQLGKERANAEEEVNRQIEHADLRIKRSIALTKELTEMRERLDRAVGLIKRVPYRAAGDKWIEDRNAFLAPSQPEPVKAPPNDLGPHDCVFDDDGLCRIGSRTEMHRAPIVPENAGTHLLRLQGPGCVHGRGRAGG